MQSPLVKIFWAAFMAVGLLIAVNVAADGVMRRSQQPATAPTAVTKPGVAKPTAPALVAAKPITDKVQPQVKPVSGAVAATVPAARVADLGQGAAVSRKCAGCHTLEAGQPNRVGPNLHGIVGDKVAGRAGFAYSAAMQAKGGTWSREALDAFLTAPATAVSGTKMAFPGLPNGDDRADLIAYLESLAGKAATAAAPAVPAAEPPQVPATPAVAALVPAALVPAAPVPATEAPSAPATPVVVVTVPASEPAATAATDAPPAVADDIASVIADGPPMRAELANLLAAGNVERGRKLAKACLDCHSVEAKGGKTVGPNLRGVVGRDIGGQTGFAYSVTLQALEGNWIYDWLDQFLAQPDMFAPGTKMTFAGLKDAKERADVIVYLRSLSPKAPPLPSPVVWLVPEPSAN